MTLLQQLLVVVGFIIWLDNTTYYQVSCVKVDPDRSPRANTNDYPGSEDRIRSISIFGNPQVKREGQQDLTASFMEAGAEMGSRKGYSCTACGDECSSSCGTRYFRTCCFHFSKKKKSHLPSRYLPFPFLSKSSRLQSISPSAMDLPHNNPNNKNNNLIYSKSNGGTDIHHPILLISTRKRSAPLATWSWSWSSDENAEDTGFNGRSFYHESELEHPEEPEDALDTDGLYPIYGTTNSGSGDSRSKV